jgi:hypothetical protein
MNSIGRTFAPTSTVSLHNVHVAGLGSLFSGLGPRDSVLGIRVQGLGVRPRCVAGFQFSVQA